MNEIVNRLTENRRIELAKSILESNGYKVTKRLKESSELSNADKSWKETADNFWRYNSGDNSHYSTELNGIVYYDEDYKFYGADIAKDGRCVDRKSEFSTPEEAKAWVEDWFSKRFNESKKLKESILQDIEGCKDCWTLEDYVDMMYSEFEEYEGVVSFITKYLEKSPNEVRVATQQSDFDTSTLVSRADRSINITGPSHECALNYYGGDEKFTYECGTLDGVKVVVGSELDNYEVLFF